VDSNPTREPYETPSKELDERGAPVRKEEEPRSPSQEAGTQTGGRVEDYGGDVYIKIDPRILTQQDGRMSPQTVMLSPGGGNSPGLDGIISERGNIQGVRLAAAELECTSLVPPSAGWGRELREERNSFKRTRVVWD